ncbi:MAG: hypothetical protein IJP54_09070 [Synergistaceae bacterium]|nr:hypothetical protein [Synergistaceae bacterium]
MSYQSNSDLVLRRTAFYSSTLYNLQQLIRDIQGDKACKWCTDTDENTMNHILSQLSCAEFTLIIRYQDVLREHADDLQNSLEAKHERSGLHEAG